MANAAPITAASNFPTFTYEEFEAIIATASQLGVKVAVHAADWRRIASLPFSSIEHGNESLPLDVEDCDEDDLVKAWRADGLGKQKTIWVPTLAVMYTFGGERWKRAFQQFRAALAAGFDNFACGGDTGPFPHGENALELRLMLAAGAPWQNILAWATLGGWRCIRPMTWEGPSGEARLAQVGLLKEDPRVVGDNEVPFGVLRKGFAADIIATSGDLEKNFSEAVQKENISFVMKGGNIYKRDGKESQV